jgi:hypothetical protein
VDQCKGGWKQQPPLLMDIVRAAETLAALTNGHYKGGWLNLEPPLQLIFSKKIKITIIKFTAQHKHHQKSIKSITSSQVRVVVVVGQ